MTTNDMPFKESTFRPRYKFVDSREPEIIRQKLLEVGWEQKALLSGDFFFMTHDYLKVGVTRKNVNDFLGSMGDRFSQQLEVMLDFYDIRIMLLEGSWKAATPNMNLMSGRGMEYITWDMAWDYIQRWEDKGFTVQLTVDETHTTQRLNKLYAIYQKEYSLTSKSKKYTDDRVLAFPSGCRGETAMNVLKIFGSLKNVANAKQEDFLGIEKIGQKKSNLIYNHFNTTGQDYKEMLNKLNANNEEVVKEDNNSEQQKML